MKFTAVAATAAAFVGTASAGSKSDERTFAVLRFNGKNLVQTRVDPIVSPGKTASHVHGVMGGSNFGVSATGETLSQSKCTNAMINGDNSAYWYPLVYFQDPKTKKLEPVEMFYTNVYYFFDGTDDEIKAFPRGLQIVSGNVSTRAVPPGGGKSNLEPADGPIQPVQWTCPRSNYNPASYPANSDGTTAGIVDPNNDGSGVGFPDQNCDGYGSPLRADVHMPSCYNPKAALDDHENNMAWPSNKGASNSRRKNCPEGWIHVPHMFFEVYWDTPKFADRWTPGQGAQPFVLSNGDTSGYSSHADFIAAWDEPVLQQIIDNCNAGSSGMDKCPGLLKGLNTNKDCTIPSPIDEKVTGILDKLPGNNPLSGWSLGSVIGGGGDDGAVVKPPSPGASSSAAGSAKPASSKAAASSGAIQKEDIAKPSATAVASQLPVQNAPVQEAPVKESPAAPAPSQGGQSSAAAIPTSPLGNDKPAPSKSSSCQRSTKTVWATVTVTATTDDTQASAAATPKKADNYKARRHEHVHRHRSGHRK